MYKYPLLHARNCSWTIVGTGSSIHPAFWKYRYPLAYDYKQRVWTTASSGGVDAGNVGRSRLLCSILVFKVATRTDLMYTMHLYLLSLFMIRRLPYEVCEPKYILLLLLLLLLLNVYVEQDNNWRTYVQCIDFVDWYPVRCDSSVFFY
jgi:hypothetical protein